MYNSFFKNLPTVTSLQLQGFKRIKKTHHCAILMLSQTLMLMCLVRGFTSTELWQILAPLDGAR